MHYWEEKKDRSNKLKINIFMNATYTENNISLEVEGCPQKNDFENFYYNMHEQWGIGLRHRSLFQLEGNHHLIYRCKDKVILERDSKKDLPTVEINLI